MKHSIVYVCERKCWQLDEQPVDLTGWSFTNGCVVRVTNDTAVIEADGFNVTKRGTLSFVRFWKWGQQ